MAANHDPEPETTMATTTKKQPAKKTAATPEAITPKEPPAKPAAPAKKLSQIEAALTVLQKKGDPMTCKEMLETMTKQKLWSSPAGKTPEATLYASILRDLKKDEPRFKKAAPGKFSAKA